MVSKRIRRTATGIIITGGIIAALAIISGRVNLGERVVGASAGLGSTVGQAITAPFNELIKSFSRGASDIAESGATAGADFQQFVTGNRNAIGDFFAGLSGEQPQGESGGLSFLQRIEPALRLGPTAGTGTGRFVPQGELRLTQDLIDIGVTGDPDQTGSFGGFGSRQAQEEAARRLIEENKRKFPQFFK